MGGAGVLLGRGATALSFPPVPHPVHAYTRRAAAWDRGAVGAQRPCAWSRRQRQVAAAAGRGGGSSWAASEGGVREDKAGRCQLPIFPLGLVAAPGADVPLQIFEARYRVLFNTLLAGAEDVDDGLVDADSPFKGSRLFGMSFAPGNGIAVTGTALHIVEHSQLKDGRLLVGSKGGQRYRVIQVIKELPVLICEVEWLKDEPDVMKPDDDFTLEELGVETRQLFLNTLKLSNKTKTGNDDDEPEGLAQQLEKLNAQELSFWMMNVFAEHPSEQQMMLDMTSARERLERARSVLRETLSYLSATSALKSALSDIEKKENE